MSQDVCSPRLDRSCYFCSVGPCVLLYRRAASRPSLCGDEVRRWAASLVLIWGESGAWRQKAAWLLFPAEPLTRLAILSGVTEEGGGCLPECSKILLLHTVFSFSSYSRNVVQKVTGHLCMVTVDEAVGDSGDSGRL